MLDLFGNRESMFGNRESDLYMCVFLLLALCTYERIMAKLSESFN